MHMDPNPLSESPLLHQCTVAFENLNVTYVYCDGDVSGCLLRKDGMVKVIYVKWNT